MTALFSEEWIYMLVILLNFILQVGIVKEEQLKVHGF